MSLRLRIFLALALTSGGLLLSYAVWQAVVMRHGFLAYLDQVSLQQLAPAAAPLVQRWQDDGGTWDRVLAEPGAMHRIVESATGRQRRPPGPGPGPGPGSGPHHPRPFGTDALPHPHPAPLRPRPPPPSHPLDWMGRLALHDASGRTLIGPAGASAELGLTLRAPDQTVIGSLRLLPMRGPEAGLQAEFVRHQITRAGIFVGLAVLLAALTGWWLSRRLTRPLTAIMQGSAALAAGNYAHRVPAPTGPDELHALARHFNLLAAALEQHREQRRQLGADLAHELRTPLTILEGELQLLQDGVRPLDAQALHSLIAETARLSSLVEDLYQLALADAGSLEYHCVAMSLSDLVLATAARWQGVLESAGLHLSLQVDPEVHIEGDAHRLERLLDNLLGNARRYTDAPGQIRLRLQKLAHGALLCVADSAPGVPPEALSRLTERLYRVDQSRSRAAGGAGLGLAIVASIVDAHGGSLDLHTSDLGGLAVTIRLPAVAGSRLGPSPD